MKLIGTALFSGAAALTILLAPTATAEPNVHGCIEGTCGSANTGGGSVCGTDGICGGGNANGGTGCVDGVGCITVGT